MNCCVDQKKNLTSIMYSVTYSGLYYKKVKLKIIKA